jgi:FkbM family methyltransferase
MPPIQRLLNSKAFQRFRRSLALKSGIYCRIKKLSPTVSEDMRVVRLLQYYKINKVLDIGANTGQFAESLIDFGYKGEIISFEPVDKNYKELQKRAAKYKQWTLAERCAVGNQTGTISINVSEATDFSSIKSIKNDFVKKQNSAKTVQQEVINIYPLDYFYGKHFTEDDRILVKIDTQGYEKEVIEGAPRVMQQMAGIKLEMPLSMASTIYDNVEWSLNEYVKLFQDLNLECVSLEPIAADKQSGRVYEVDAVFIRKNS